MNLVRLGALLVLAGLLAPSVAEAEATPMFTFHQEVAMEAVKGTALEGLKYYSPPLFIAAKSVDVLLAEGKAGVEEEDRTIGAQMVRSEQLANQLKALHQAGVSTRDSPEAQAIRTELDGFARGMATDKDGLAYAAYAVGKHPAYSLSKALIAIGIEAGVGRLEQTIGLGEIVERLPMGGWIKRLLGRQSPFRGHLRAVGWSRLGTRSTVARKINDVLIAKMVTSEAEKFVGSVLGEIENSVRRDVWLDRYNALHREPLVYTGRLDMARLLLPVAVAPPPRAIAAPLPPPVAVAAPVSVFIPPRAAVPLVPFDPVARVVGSEDMLVEPSIRQGPVEREPEMRQAPPEPEPEMRQDDSHAPDIDVGSYFRDKSFNGNSSGLWGG